MENKKVVTRIKEKLHRGKFIFLILIMFAVGAIGGLSVRWKEAYERFGRERPHESVEAADTVAPPPVTAAGAILIETSQPEGGTGDFQREVLFEKDADKKLYPASTTKIMTALVTLETLDQLGLGIDSEVIIPKEAQGVEGSSIYLKKGERLTIEELLYGLMLQSGNDSAVALAICIGGNEDAFVEKMNKKAADLGCLSTHFANPSGLHHEEHYTTARELAIIASEAMKREDFRKIVSSKSWQSKTSNRNITNKNKTVFQYEDATGIKIGYTMAAGRTLVASSKRNGRELIAVVLNDGNWFNDAYSLMDYGFKKIGVETNSE